MKTFYTHYLNLECKVDQSPKAKELLNKHIILNLNQVIQYLLTDPRAHLNCEEWFEDLLLQSTSIHGEGEEGDCEYVTREPYEFWAVSSYFGEFLKKKDELVTDFWGFYLWGRETTGQSILLDYVFQEFVKEHSIR